MLYLLAVKETLYLNPLTVLKLKYQTLIDKNNLSDCPNSENSGVDLHVFRWAHFPIENPINFLPNLLYDEARGMPPRVLEPADLCSCCGISFFDDLDTAITRLDKHKRMLEKKHQVHTSYTHVAGGQIQKTDGLATKIHKHHLGFYEFEGVDFREKFIIIHPKND